MPEPDHILLKELAQERLGRLRELVSQAETRLSQMREEMARLKADGHDVSTANAVIQTFEETLRAMNEVVAVEESIATGPADPVERRLDSYSKR